MRFVIKILKLYFTNINKKFQQWKLDIPLGQVSRIEKVGRKTTSVAKRGDDNYGFTIYCKDYRVYRFTCNPASSDRKNVCDSLNRYAFPLSHNLVSFFFNFNRGLLALELLEMKKNSDIFF